MVKKDNMDLTKFLKPGDKIFSLVQGKILKVAEIDLGNPMPIKVGGFRYSKCGSVLADGSDCLLFPSEEKRDWSGYSPFKPGDIVLVYNEGDKKRLVRVYSHMEGFKHFVYDHIETEPPLKECESFSNCEYFKPSF